MLARYRVDRPVTRPRSSFAVVIAESPAAGYPTGRVLTRWSRPRAFVVVCACYLLAAVTALVTAYALRRHHPDTVAFVADVVATVVIFLLSMLVANSSLYDPYWSVAPPLVALGWAALGAGDGMAAGVPVRQVLVILLVAIWAVRLTANWAAGWRGFGHEDWRYVQLRHDTAGRLPWWLVSLTGIQLMPTVVVFLGLLPLWPALVAGRAAAGPLDVLALAVTATAIAIESAADLQLRRFTADPANRTRAVDRGLWAYSRHPNYFGEITFWWGLWLFGLAADPSWWWTVVGPLGMVVLFQGASIPMMETRLLRRRPGYAARVAGVPRLVPRPWRSRPPAAVGPVEPDLPDGG